MSVTAPMSGRYLPRWALQQVQGTEPEFDPGDRVTLLDLEVREPGLVKVQGIWLEREHGAIITPDGLHFVQAMPGRDRSTRLAGHGPDSLLFVGAPIGTPVTTTMFGFEPQQPAVIDLPR
jgi:hypothetical protein